MYSVFNLGTNFNFIYHNFTRRYLVSSIWLLFMCFLSVITYFVSKVVPPEKNDEALQLLKIIWNAIAEKPKKEIDNILRGSAEYKLEDKPSTGNVDQAKQLYRLNNV